MRCDNFWSCVKLRVENLKPSPVNTKHESIHLLVLGGKDIVVYKVMIVTSNVIDHSWIAALHTLLSSSSSILRSGAIAMATLLRVGRSNTLQMNRPASNNFSKSMPVERPIPCLTGRDLQTSKMLATRYTP